MGKVPAVLATLALGLFNQAARADEPRPLWTGSAHHFEVHSVAFSSDGKILASAT